MNGFEMKEPMCFSGHMFGSKFNSYDNYEVRAKSYNWGTCKSKYTLGEVLESVFLVALLTQSVPSLRQVVCSIRGYIGIASATAGYRRGLLWNQVRSRLFSISMKMNC